MQILMTKTNNIYLKPKAYEDLESIYNYSLSKFGKAKAIEYIGDINSVFTKLCKNELIGSDCDYIKHNLLKNNVNSHVIFYKIKQNEIEVFRILHQKQDYIRHL